MKKKLLIALLITFLLGSSAYCEGLKQPTGMDLLRWIKQTGFWIMTKEVMKIFMIEEVFLVVFPWFSPAEKIISSALLIV